MIRAFPDLFVPIGTTVSVPYMKQICAVIVNSDVKGISEATLEHNLKLILDPDHKAYPFYELRIGNDNHLTLMEYFRFENNELHYMNMDAGGSSSSIPISMALPDDVSYRVGVNGITLVCDDETEMLIRLSMS